MGIPTDRFMAMLEYLPRWPGEISTEEMKAKLINAGFDVSLRTVQRDLEFMLDTDPSLDRNRTGRDPYRYCFKADAPVVISPSIDDHTALAFQMADAFLKEFMPPETIAALKPFVRKAEKRLSNRKQIAAARWKDRIHVFPLGLRRKPPRILPEVRDTVYQALLEDKALRIAHASRGQKEIKEFTISPLGLVIRGYLIYLFALPKEQYERSRKQVLAFAMHRMRRAEILNDERYVRPEGFCLADYEDLASLPIKGSQILRLKMRVGPNTAFSLDEYPLMGWMRLVGDTADPTGESSILSAEVPNTVELRQWIRSLGPNAEVLEPPGLREEMALEIAELMGRYQAR